MIAGWGGGLRRRQAAALSAFLPRTAQPPLHTRLPPPQILVFTGPRCIIVGVCVIRQGWVGYVNALCILYSMYCSLLHSE